MTNRTPTPHYIFQNLAAYAFLYKNHVILHQNSRGKIQQNSGYPGHEYGTVAGSRKVPAATKRCECPQGQTFSCGTGEALGDREPGAGTYRHNPGVYNGSNLWRDSSRWGTWCGDSKKKKKKAIVIYSSLTQEGKPYRYYLALNDSVHRRFTACQINDSMTNWYTNEA